MKLTSADVADYLGRPDDGDTIARAAKVLPLASAMIRGYCRDRGWTLVDGEWIPADDIAAVVLTVTARMLANPEGIDLQIGEVRMGAGFQGYSLGELATLHRYRVRAL